jgi:adenosylcobinamide hydrolase
MNINIVGVTADLNNPVDHQYLSIRSNQPLYTLNSSIWGGGFGMHHVIVNRQVNKGYLCDNPAEEMRSFLLDNGELPEKTTGMLTAAYVRDVGYSTEYLALKDNPAGAANLHVSSWVTVGLGNTARAGMTKNTDLLYPGTINIIVLVDGILTDSALVNAVITATEAKTALLQDLQIKVSGEEVLATGTTTDAIIIAATQRGASYTYAGTATKLGYLIGKTVYNAAKASAVRYLEAVR